MQFNGLGLIDVANYSHGIDPTEILSVDWSPDGRFLAIGGEQGDGEFEVRVFSVMDAPSRCLLECNTVCNAHGPDGFQGIGIYGSGQNSYFGNYAYANNVNFNEAVYPTFLYPVFGPLDRSPRLMDNIGNLFC